MLRSWGIDTAADVDAGKIADIPGFGKNLTDKLVIWRDMKDKAFNYNAAPIVDRSRYSASIGSSLPAAPS